MTFETGLTHPLQVLSQFVARSHHCFQEWVRHIIIDDDPYDVEVWRDGEFVIAECEHITYYASITECEPDELLDYIQTELERYLG